MNEILNISNVHGYMDKQSGTAYLNAEDVARGFGFTREKNGVEYIRWDRVNQYLHEFGFSPLVGKDDFLPENMVYRLGFKANNEVAQKFQALLADEVLPSIRKNGGYITGQDTLSDNELMARALLLAQRVIDDKTKQITEMKPKADFYDTVANTESLFSMADVAKTLDMGLGRNKLFAFLRDKGILDKDNHPYQKYVDAGYLRLIENHCKAGDNDVVYKCTYVKQKGIDYIRKILLKERGLNENMG